MMAISSNNRDIILQYIKFVQRHLHNNRLLITGMVACIIANTVSNYYLPIISQLIIDKGLVGQNHKLLIQSVVAFFILNLINVILLFLQELMNTRLSADIKGDLLNEMFIQMLEVDTSFYKGKSFTELYDQVQTDIDILVSGIGGLFIVILGELATVIGGFLGLVSISSKMTLIILAFIPIYYAIISVFSMSRKQMMHSYIDFESRMAGWLDDTISGINEIKIYGLSHLIYDEFSDRQTKLIKKESDISIHESYTSSITGILNVIVIISVYGFGSFYYFRNMISLGSIVAFVTYTEYVISPIAILVGIKYRFATIIPSYGRYCDFIGYSREEAGTKDVPKNKTISFSRVTLFYRQTLILKDASFSIYPNEITVLTGINGSGKSTILNLLTRFLIPQDGIISMAEVDINDIKLKEYRSIFSYIAQTPFIFNDTIRQNISLGGKVCDAKMERMIEEIAGPEFI